jgi:hypothetical protein
MLFAEDPYTKQLMFRMVIDNKGKDWRVMTAPKNPTNTNFLDIITADVVMINWPNPKGFIGYYTIDHEKRLHDRKKCNCGFNFEYDRVIVNFMDNMGLAVQNIKFLGENDMDLTLAPCMIDDEV